MSSEILGYKDCEWKLVDFNDLFLDDTKNGRKITKDNYLNIGEYPIIDQGQQYIAGFADESEGLYSNVPAIIFGDHTRIIKYVDMPFFLGADGVKLLKSKISDIDYKYLYYFMLTANIPNTGYNRHFKWLKDLKIPLPPLEVQKKIADILDKASELIEKRKTQIAKLDELTKSVFIDMFGDPVTNPKGWEIKKLDDIALRITDGTHQSPKFYDEGIPFLLISNIVNNKIEYKTKKFISKDEYEHLIKRTPIEIGDVLLTIVGSYGNAAVVLSEKKFCFQRHIAYIKPKKDILNSNFLHTSLLSTYVKRQLDEKVKGIAQKTLNLSELKQIQVNLPPIDLQNEFAEVVEKIEEQKSLLNQGLEKLELNYKSLMQKLFN